MKLWASSSALDTDFTAKLIDVHPPSRDYPAGIDMNLEDGIIRARFRNSLEKAELMKPGEIYEFTIQLYPTSNLFKAGHRIRLDISSSNFPRFDLNPNTGEPLNCASPHGRRDQHDLPRSRASLARDPADYSAAVEPARVNWRMTQEF